MFDPETQPHQPSTTISVKNDGFNFGSFFLTTFTFVYASVSSFGLPSTCFLSNFGSVSFSELTTANRINRLLFVWELLTFFSLYFWSMKRHVNLDFTIRVNSSVCSEVRLWTKQICRWPENFINLRVGI